MKRTLFVTFTILIFFITGCSNKESTISPNYIAAPSANTTENTSVSNYIIITDNTIFANTDSIEFNMVYPVLSGLKDTELQTKINSYLEKTMTEMVTSLESQAIEQLEASKKSNSDFLKFKVSSMYKLTYSSDKLLSFQFDISEFTGGVHSIELRQGYTFDLKTANLLRLSDILDEKSNYKTILRDEIVKNIKNHAEEYYQEAASNIAYVTDQQSFYLEENSEQNRNVVIVYQMYDIAPYAGGTKEFRIPFSILKFKI